MFKKLVKMISEIKSEGDCREAWGAIDRAFEDDRITFADHEMLYNLVAMIEVED